MPKMKRMKEKISETQASEETWKREVIDMKAAAEVLSAKHEEELTKHKKSVDEAQRELSTLRESVVDSSNMSEMCASVQRELEASLAREREQVRICQDEVEVLKLELQTTCTQLKQSESSLSEQVQRAEQLEQQLKQSESSLSEHVQRAEQLEQQLKQSESSLSEQVERAEQLEQQLKQSEERVVSLEKEISSARSDSLATESHLVKELEAKLEVKSQEFDTLKKRVQVNIYYKLFLLCNQRCICLTSLICHSYYIYGCYM
jgi:chromosome segregation ATPase